MKIGILTMLYGETNYGAVLQAYALARVVSEQGHDVEQILYDFRGINNPKVKIYNLFQLIRRIIHLDFESFSDIKLCDRFRSRRLAVEEFVKKEIPTSSKYYTDKDLDNCNDVYDCIIVGSDQVWSGASKSMLLSFFDKRKVSYSASIARESLSDEQIVLFKQYLPDYYMISVREKKAQQLLSSIDISSEVVLDPTLLLDKNVWAEKCIDNPMEAPYLFCYFLGGNMLMREKAIEFAKNKKYKIATFPHMRQKYEKNDDSFGDVQIYDASPSDFLSYIKNAEAIFTDSFHASVFSCIFEKPLVVFDRSYEGHTMSSRIIELLELFGRSECFFTSNKNLVNIPPVTFTMSNKWEEEKNRSVLFLKTALS